MSRTWTGCLGFRAVVMVALASCLAGCGGGGEVPKTYPVTGEVVFKGGEPLKGGLVEFQPPEGPSLLLTQGEIQADGRFSLWTLVNDRKVPGALPGRHRVKVHPPQGDDQSMEEVKVLQAEYTVEPSERNHFQIVIERVRPPR